MRALLIVALALSLTPRVSEAAPLVVTLKARAQQPGEVVLVTVRGDVTGDVHLRAFGHDVPLAPAGAGQWTALVGIDLDTKPGVQEIQAWAGTGPASEAATTRTRLQVIRKAFPTRTLTVDPAFVEPPSDEAARIRAEAIEMDRLWKTVTPARLWTTAFELPVPGATASRFGSRSVYNGKPSSPHAGADLRGTTGTPVHAPAAGRVMIARALYFSGNTVVLDHGQGVYSLLAHLSSITVQAGDTVAGGQLVGAVGATGRVTGPHLHWAVRLGGARVDPLSLIWLFQ